MISRTHLSAIERLIGEFDRRRKYVRDHMKRYWVRQEDGTYQPEERKKTDTDSAVFELVGSVEVLVKEIKRLQKDNDALRGEIKKLIDSIGKMRNRL